jgi:DNA polymerase II large subunit
MRYGGLRLRYGRTRITGLAAAAIHPQTMHILNNYIATGTQIKTERPGKGCTVTVCDTIEGPIVRLEDGSVMAVETEQEFKEIETKVKEILFLGDILISYGDFLNRAHTLIPPGYNEEWWIQELEKATVATFGSLDLYKLSELTEIPQKELEELSKDPLRKRISAAHAISLSKKLNIPLHPRYTYHWKLITKEQLSYLVNSLKKANIVREGEKIQKIIIPFEKEAKRTLELVGLPHLFVNQEFIVIEKNHATAFGAQINISLIEPKLSEAKDVLSIVHETSSVKLRDKSGIFVGGRMGRPEKAKIRKLTGSPHNLFPVGKEGDRLRSFQAAMETGKINSIKQDQIFL